MGRRDISAIKARPTTKMSEFRTYMPVNKGRDPDPSPKPDGAGKHGGRTSSVALF